MFIVIETFPVCIVPTNLAHVGFVKHSTDDGFMYIGRRIECLLNDIDFGPAPFDHQDHAVNQLSSYPSIDHWRKRRKVDYDEIKAFTQLVEKPSGCL